MAERRMFAKTIADSDAFLEMPQTSQNLYFHLSMRADDDGFVNNPKRIQRMVGCSDDDMRILIGKSFIIPFESGIIVIKHWRINNYIQKDRYKPTVYQDEFAQLKVKENGAYTLCIQDGYKLDTQDRLGKVSIDKNNIIYNDQSKTVRESDLISEFEQLWSIYPRKEGKKKAQSAYLRARKKGTTYEAVRQGIDDYNRHLKAKKTDKKYIKQGATWFNGECWNDELDFSRTNENGAANFTEREYKDGELNNLMRDIEEYDL